VKLKLFGIILLPFTLVGLAVLSDRFYAGSICVWQNIFGHFCWGCGLTHATLFLLSGKFAAAYASNKLVFIVLPLLFYLWLKAIIREIIS
jgi:hypothetical protein